MTVQIIRQYWHWKYQCDVIEAAGLSTDDKPAILTPGSKFHESDTGDDYISGALGWTPKPAVANAEVDVETLPGTTQADIAAMKAKIDTVQADIALIKAGILISAALPAGDNNIGNVDIVTLPNVTIGANAPLADSEAHIGEVNQWSDLIVVTPTIAAAAFAANDFVGGKLTLANAVRVATGKGAITGLKIVDAAKQNAGLLVFLFKADLAGAYADNAAESVSAADWLNWIGTIEIQASDWQEMANTSLVDLGFEMDVEATAGRDLYALIVTTGTPTYTANCLQLTFGMRG